MSVTVHDGLPVFPGMNTKKYTTVFNEDIQVVRSPTGPQFLTEYAHNVDQYKRDKSTFLTSLVLGSIHRNRFTQFLQQKRRGPIGTYLSRDSPFGKHLSQLPGHYENGNPEIRQAINTMVAGFNPGVTNDMYASPAAGHRDQWLSDQIGASPWDQGGGVLFEGLTENSRDVRLSGKTKTSDAYLVKKKKKKSVHFAPNVKQ